MKAVQFYGRRDVRVAEVAKPEPKPDQVLIDIEWCGICGSDLHEYIMGPAAIPSKRPHPLTGEVLPITLGHEFCGRVVSAPADSHLKPGQAVMIDPRLYCKSCSRCSTKSTNACCSWGFHGLSGAGGGFSESIAVDPSMCYPLPDSVPLELAALIEPLAVAWRAVKLTNIDDFGNRPILVLGGGPVGIAVIFVLRAKGAKRVFVSEPTTRRAEQNAQLADVVFNPIKEDVGERCRELTGGEGVDFVFDCAGIPSGFENGMDALRYRGTYVNIAGYEKPMTIPLRYFMFKEVTLMGSLAYDDQDFKETVEAFIQGKFKGVEKMVTSRIHLDDVPNKGFEELVTNKDDHIKILVTPKRENLGAV
ncbi:threonine dehydrogenase [Lepidopterella palustris CBS 459.81]|uniref:Threonine dehydrogenase n=1 Tax=Lepidopterella palustris CBS 459.81 TaxID=1314670 RepID=A0A8E2JD14_9PEZI|nr:threonine dehydrogenase [Lepidopterella palustris CBS 459.81]